MNTAQKMARKSSTKQHREATTEEVPGSIVIYTKEEINTFIAILNFQCFCLHTISFSFATKEVKGVNCFPSRENDLEIRKKDVKDKRLVNSVKYIYYP